MPWAGTLFTFIKSPLFNIGNLHFHDASKWFSSLRARENRTYSKYSISGWVFCYSWNLTNQHLKKVTEGSCCVQLLSVARWLMQLQHRRAASRMCFCKAKLHCKIDIFQYFSKDSLAILWVWCSHLELLKLFLSNGYTTDH